MWSSKTLLVETSRPCPKHSVVHKRIAYPLLHNLPARACITGSARTSDNPNNMGGAKEHYKRRSDEEKQNAGDKGLTVGKTLNATQMPQPVEES